MENKENTDIKIDALIDFENIPKLEMDSMIDSLYFQIMEHKEKELKQKKDSQSN